MSAYVVSIAKVKDPSRFRVYLSLCERTLAPFGARALAIVDPHALMRRPASYTAVAGQSWPNVVTTVLEFPSLKAAHCWFASAEYAEAKILRDRAADVTMAIAPGIDSVATMHATRLAS